MAQMYACGLFETKILDDWDETANNSWGETHPHFTQQFNKERRKIEGEKSQEHFEISIVFRKDLHPHTLEIPQGGETNTRTDSSFIADMEYAAALEEKSIV